MGVLGEVFFEVYPNYTEDSPKQSERNPLNASRTMVLEEFGGFLGVLGPF